MGGSANRWPAWLRELDDEDLMFLRRFLFCSGSLKDLAAEYGVSYPTIRSRLDRLIGKARVAEQARDADALERKVRMLVADGGLPAATAKELLAAHRAALKERRDA